MEANDPLEDLLSELRRLRAEGVETVAVSPESTEILRSLVGKAPAPSGQAASAPVSRPAKAEDPGSRPPSRQDPVPPPPSPRREPLATPMPEAAKPLLHAPKFDDSAIPEPPRVELPAKGSKVDRLAALAELIQTCPECRRHLKPGQEPMLGAGSPDAAIVFVGEVPAAADIAAGRLFAGVEAAVFDGALKAMGLSRETAYVTTLVRWRTASPNGLVDRTPSPREQAFNLPYLRAELAVVRPRVVVALGGTVFHALTGDKARISEARGTWREAEGLPLLPTFHPSYLVKNPSKGPKRQFWEDLLAAMERAGLPISEKQRGFFR